MVTIYLCGGLGNQMFQYAFAKFLESKGFAVALEATHFLPESKEAFGLANASAGIGGGQDTRDLELAHFAITLPILSKPELFSHFYGCDRWFWFFRIYHKFMRIVPKPLYQILQALLPSNRKSHPYKSTITEAKLGEAIPLHSITSDTRVFGYYGNLSYIKGLEEILRRDFTCPLTPANRNLQAQIQATPNATFIHIRRGDYLRLWQYLELGKAYYECAITQVLKALGGGVHFFVFSNDIAWCKQEFLGLLDRDVYAGCSFSFIDNNDESNPTQELMLMRSCQHAITANSTFSWWAAYLIENPHKIVIMPSIHLLDEPDCTINIMPDDWIVLNPTWGNQVC